MTSVAPARKWQSVVLWSTLLLYLAARLLQLDAERIPSLLIVLLHVIPPALFAVVHGGILYRARGILVYTTCCIGVGSLCESLSLRTGFPFGHYYFTNVMGPKMLGLPFLLVLAYLGIGYCSWILSVLILGDRYEPLSGARVVAVPVLASFIMVAWDLAMDPDWSTIDRAWIWRDGGAFFGVPVSNYFGWALTAYLFYQAFALYCRRCRVVPAAASPSLWRTAILFYAVCATGNLLVLRQPMAPAVVTDATGTSWRTADILETCALVSLLVMGPMALLAWLRLRDSEADPRGPAKPAI